MDIIKEKPSIEFSRWKLTRSIKEGMIIQEPCSKCGNKKSLAHHEDYSKSLEVTWLCRSCHVKRHAQIRREKILNPDVPVLLNDFHIISDSPYVHNDGFQKAFYNLPHHELNSVKDELMDNLGWSIASFYYKKRGVAPIRENEIPVIELIFSGFGIDPWTGNKL